MLRRLGTDRVRGLGVALLVGAFACGGRARDELQPPPPPQLVPAFASASPQPPAGAPPRPAPAPAATSVPAEMPQGSTPARAGMSMPMQAPPSETMTSGPPFGPNEWNQARVAAENVLASNCGVCHGPNAPIEASAGIRFINDADQLVAAGLIVPLNSASSEIVRVMLRGTMPPPSSGLPFVTQADINVVTEYIDNPIFWPGDPALPMPPAAGSPDAGVVETPLADAGADGG